MYLRGKEMTVNIIVLTALLAWELWLLWVTTQVPAPARLSPDPIPRLTTFFSIKLLSIALGYGLSTQIHIRTCLFSFLRTMM